MLDPTSCVSADRRFEGLVGDSEAIRSVFVQIRRVAKTNVTVLIRGESGTGKELVAEAIHRNSPRRSGPFSAVNMAAVPETLVESELFGHVKGAFTGAAGERCGRFEAADGGTLFIDEIGDLQLTSQAKLLRVLENRCVSPVGGNETRHVDVRVIAATNKELETLVAEDKFREDLYYRLNVVTITLPPLRQRREDISLLVEYFLHEVAEENDREVPQLDDQLQEFLRTYDWPGNVRQLRNCIESMVVLASADPLTMADLPPMVKSKHGEAEPALDIPLGVTLEELEAAAIRQTLGHLGGNRTRAARMLGISVRTLQRKLKRWDGIEPARGARERRAGAGRRSPMLVG